MAAHHTPEEKRAIVQIVCDLYESQGSTIESCCDAAGVSYRLFKLWLAQNSEFSELSKKAKERECDIYWERLQEKAKTSFERLIDGEERVEVKEEGSDKDGYFVVSKKVVLTTKSLPNAAAVIFAMKGEFPDKYADRSLVSMKTETINSETLTPELIDKIDALLGDGKGDDDSTSIPGKQKRQRGGV